MLGLQDQSLQRHFQFRSAVCCDGPTTCSVQCIASMALSQPGWPTKGKASPFKTPWAAQSWAYSSSSAITNTYWEITSLLRTGLIQGSPPFHLPTEYGGRTFHLLGLELNRWGPSLDTSRNQPNQHPSLEEGGAARHQCAIQTLYQQVTSCSRERNPHQHSMFLILHRSLSGQVTTSWVQKKVVSCLKLMICRWRCRQESKIRHSTAQMETNSSIRFNVPPFLLINHC